MLNEERIEEIAAVIDMLNEQDSKTNALIEQLRTYDSAFEREIADTLEHLVAERDEWQRGETIATKMVGELELEVAALNRCSEHQMRDITNLCSHIAASEQRIKELEAECAKVPELDVLAEYTGKDGKREWKDVGSWLRPGECIAVVASPQPDQEFTAEEIAMVAAPWSYLQPEPKAEQQEPVAWCVAYDDPSMGRIHSNPSMYKPELEALISRASSNLVLVPLYAAPPDLAAEVEEQARLLGMSAEREADLRGEVERLTTALKKAREVLDECRGNINTERSFADELEHGVGEAIATINEVMK